MIKFFLITYLTLVNKNLLKYKLRATIIKNKKNEKFLE
jgi:hypothetical protein